MAALGRHTEAYLFPLCLFTLLAFRVFWYLPEHFFGTRPDSITFSVSGTLLDLITFPVLAWIRSLFWHLPKLYHFFDTRPDSITFLGTRLNSITFPALARIRSLFWHSLRFDHFFGGSLGFDHFSDTCLDTITFLELSRIRSIF